jgi:hypothetical protein
LPAGTVADDDDADDDEEEEQEEEAAASRTQIAVRAGAKLAAGVAVCAFFSDPLVEALSNLSQARDKHAAMDGWPERHADA